MDSSCELPTAVGIKTIRPWWRSRAAAALFAAILSSGAAWWLIAWPVMSFGNVEKHAEHFGLVYAHMLGGTIGVAFVVVVLFSTAHKRVPDVIFTNTTISLLTLAAAWLTCAAMAYRAVRNHNYGLHRDWIIRSYVLAWSFVFCRLASRVPGIEDMGGGEAFIWLSWVGPILICEVFLHWRAGGKIAARPSLNT